MANRGNDSQLAAAWPIATTLAGIVALLAGIAWPMAGASAKVSPAEAEEYQQAALEFQKLGANEGGTTPAGADRTADLQAARERYLKIKEQLETAKQRPAAIAFWLKLAGAILAAVGAMGLMTQRGG